MGIKVKTPRKFRSDVYYMRAGSTTAYGLPVEARRQVKDQLTFSNPAYSRAIEEGDDLGGIEPYFYAYREQGTELTFPRYYVNPLLPAGEIVDVQPDPGLFEHTLLREPTNAQLPVASQLDVFEGDVGMKLPCGFGKSFLALYYAAKKPGRILIVAPNENKRNEWFGEVTKTLGYPEDQIGLIQAASRTWEQCPVVVSVLKTLAMQDFPPELLNAFSAVIWDEAHLCSAPVMSQALGRFNGRQINLSATPGSGVRRRLTDLHGGANWIALRGAEVRPFQINARFVRVRVPRWMAANSSMKWRFIKNKLGNDDHYTSVLSTLTRFALDEGRKTLVLSGFVKPLFETYLALQRRGGFVMGAASMRDLARLDPKFAEHVQAMVTSSSWKDQAAEYRERVKQCKNPILAIGMTKTQPGGMGMDVPDLDAGVVHFPAPNRDMVTQMIGRWERPVKKQDPLILVMVPNCAQGVRAARAMEAHLQAEGVHISWEEQVM